MSMENIQVEEIGEGLSRFKIGEGFTTHNVVNSLPPSLTCKLCSGLIKEAKTTRCCRTSFCSSCIEEVFLSSEYPICPGAGCCDKPLHINELDENDELCKLAQQWFLKKSTITHKMPTTTTTTCDNTASLDSGSNNPSISDQVELSNTSQVRDETDQHPVELMQPSEIVNVWPAHNPTTILPFAVPAPPPVQDDDSTREFYQIVSQANNKSSILPTRGSLSPRSMEIDEDKAEVHQISNVEQLAQGLKRFGLSHDHNDYVPPTILPAPAFQSENFKHPRVKYEESTSRFAVQSFDPTRPPPVTIQTTMSTVDVNVYPYQGHTASRPFPFSHSPASVSSYSHSRQSPPTSTDHRYKNNRQTYKRRGDFDRQTFDTTSRKRKELGEDEPIRYRKITADSTTSRQRYKSSREPARYQQRTGGYSPSRKYRPDRRSNKQLGDYRREKYGGRVVTYRYGLNNPSFK